MATSLHEGSAKIYQFPPGGRRGLAAANRPRAKAEADTAAQRLPKMVVGSGWYHEEAIREAERAVKR